MKKQSILFALLILAIAATTACGNSTSVPTFAKIAFLSNRTSTPATRLFVAKLDGTNVTPVPNAPNGYTPSISADFKKVAYQLNGNVFVENVDGTGQAQLTTSNSSNFARISPDGKKIVYSDNSAAFHLWISNIDGTAKLDLTPSTLGSTGQCRAGGFSADSSQVVMTCFDGNTNSFGMYTTKTDGTGVKTVIHSTNVSLDTPSFTPDGKKIVFFASGSLTAGASVGVVAFTPGIRHALQARQKGSVIPTFGVTSINLDGTGATLLVPGSFESLILNSTLYYTLHSGKFNQIYKANVDGTNPVSISDGTSSDYLGQSQNVG